MACGSCFSQVSFHPAGDASIVRPHGASFIPVGAPHERAGVGVGFGAGGTNDPTPSPPGEAAGWLVGPVTLYPSIVLRDVGFDSNVLNESDAAKEDFTLTAQPRLRAALPFGSALLSGSATVGFVYYATYKEQQSINRLFEGRLENTAGRLRPFLAAALTHSRERVGLRDRCPRAPPEYEPSRAARN